MENDEGNVAVSQILKELIKREWTNEQLRQMNKRFLRNVGLFAAAFYWSLSSKGSQNKVCFVVADLNAITALKPESKIENVSKNMQRFQRNFRHVHFLLYAEEDIDQIEKRISLATRVGLKPEVIIALGGAQVYQLGFREPDPYWEEQVTKFWDPKPVEWLVETALGSELRKFDCQKIYTSEFPLSSAKRIPLVLRYISRDEPKLDSDSFFFELSRTIQENGLNARVRVEQDGTSFTVSPIAVRGTRALHFICSVLQIPEEDRMIVLYGESNIMKELKSELQHAIWYPSLDGIEYSMQLTAFE
eukprot:jgi/Galph1/950/GphlegSOOS_G5694.1